MTRIFSMADTMAAIEQRRQRERWYKPDIWMFYAAKRGALDARLQVRWAWQRVFRGWDDRAAWGTGDWLGKTLGELLVNMADIAHGFPLYYPERNNLPGKVQALYTDERDETAFNRWVNDLRTHGEALLAWHRGADVTADVEDYEALLVPAQEALRWTAEYLPTLWD
jgi:hypothetical protein